MARTGTSSRRLSGQETTKVSSPSPGNTTHFHSHLPRWLKYTGERCKALTRVWREDTPSSADGSQSVQALCQILWKYLAKLHMCIPMPPGYMFTLETYTTPKIHTLAPNREASKCTWTIERMDVLWSIPSVQDHSALTRTQTVVCSQGGGVRASEPGKWGTKEIVIQDCI